MMKKVVLQMNITGPLCMVLLLFSGELIHLIQFSKGSELHSFIPLVPLISAYLIWKDREYLSHRVTGEILLPLSMALVGIVVLVLSRMGLHHRWRPVEGDLLSASTFSFVCLLNACGFFAGGKLNRRQLMFPLAFLFFMVPMPNAFVGFLTHASQHASAEVAYWFLNLSGTPILRQGLIFHLPRINLEVAPECSGLHSTLVLLITSLLAGHLFLKSSWRKWMIALVVIPIGILRNGFRILVIGWMSSNVDPSFIDSPLHHRGGPVFFLLSLVPLLALLCYFRRAEQMHWGRGWWRPLEVYDEHLTDRKKLCNRR